MPEAAESIAYVESVFRDPEGIHRFQHRDSVIYTSIPNDSLADEQLPDFIASLATPHGLALSQLISEAGDIPGTCFYGGWIDQAVFTIGFQLSSHAAGVRSLLSLLVSQPTEQNGDTVLGFVPDNLSFISLVYVSRETRFIYMSHYCDSPTVHTHLTAAR